MEKETKKITKESIVQRVNSDGEVTEQISTKEFRVPREPDYVKLYLNDLSLLNHITNSDILFVLVPKMNYDGEVFFRN